MNINRPPCPLFATGAHERAPDPLWVDAEGLTEVTFSISVQQSDEEEDAFHVQFRLEHSDDAMDFNPVPPRAVLSEGYRYNGEVFSTRRDIGIANTRSSEVKNVSALAPFTFRVRVGPGFAERNLRVRPQFIGRPKHPVTLIGSAR